MAYPTHNMKFINILPPIADRFGAGGTTGPAGVLGGASPVTAVVDVRNYRHVTFVVIHGSDCLTDDHTYTVEGCNLLLTPTIHTEVSFDYYPGGANVASGVQAVERLGAMAAATSSGFLTTTGQANHIQVLEVDVPTAEAEYFSTNAAETMIGLRMTCTETTDVPSTGCVLAILSEPRHKDEGDDMPRGAVNTT